MKAINIGISFSPYGRTYGRYGDQQFKMLKEHGYDAADYNLADTSTALYTIDEQQLKDVVSVKKQAADQAGVVISQVHGPWQWPPRDGTEQERAERMEKMQRAVEITALLGCSYLVIHPIMPCGVEDTLCGKEQETWDGNVAFFRRLADYAAMHNVILCLENMPMPHLSLSKPQRILDLVQTIGHDHLQVCLDTGHVAVFPDLTVGDEVRRLGKYIRVLHIHDNQGDEDSHSYPATGCIDWADFARALDEIGYEGVLSLETAPSGGLDDEAFAAESVRLSRQFRKLMETT